jgi:hypothetical protein
MSPEQVVEQFQQILATLKRIVDASANTAERVDNLERRTGDTLTALSSIHDNLQVLLETYQEQAESQNRLNAEVARRLADLEDRISALTGGPNRVM